MNKDYKTIEVFDNAVKANIAMNFLKNNDVEAVLADEFTGDIINVAVKGIKLQVPLDQEAKAKEILSDINEAHFVSQQGSYADSDPETVDILSEAEAFMTGHFKLTSGRHSDQYIEKIKIINQPDKVNELCKKMKERFSDLDFDIVIGPAMGGIVLAFEVARLTGKKFAFSQRKDGKMTFRSGFEVKPGMKALVIEDIVSTGGSLKEVLDLLEERKIEIAGIGLIVDRTGGQLKLNYRTETLVTLNIKSYTPEECPLCKQNLPITTPGSSDK